MQTFYTRGAFFRNEHLVAELMDLLDKILPLQFTLTMYFADLDKVLFDPQIQLSAIKTIFMTF